MLGENIAGQYNRLYALSRCRSYNNNPVDDNKTYRIGLFLLLRSTHIIKNFQSYIADQIEIKQSFTITL